MATANTNIDKKNATIAAYNYTIDAKLITNDEEYDLITENITDLLVSYEYETKNMPTVYMGIRLNTSLYNTLVERRNDSLISLTVNKFNKNSTTSLAKPYIKDNFIYKMTSNPNYNTALEDLASNGDDTTGKEYKKGYIALLKIESLNDNKVLNNGIVRNTNLSTLIYTYTKHMNMVIEQIDNNIYISQLVIPPMDSITKLIKYIDLNYAIYPSGYRYFRDFNKTYLLSSEGNPVSDGSSDINTIIIKIMDNVDEDGKLNSTQIDIQNNAYIINIDSDRTTIEINETKEKSYNKIIGVTASGKLSEYDLNISKNTRSTEKVQIQRINNENTRSIEAYKKKIERNNVILHVVKTEVDASMITPNKEYIVKNCKENRQYDGRYILVYKKEILLSQDRAYIAGVTFGLAKVPK